MSEEHKDREPDVSRSDEAATETSAEPRGGRIPKRIGQFHIKEVLASGGMGVVYRAVQEQPRRTVAVKVMKHGIASRSAMRRFKYESQVLARLHHPGIAQVYEAGTHDDGSGPVPYFAMEYVPNAKPITQYAQEKSLKPQDRLKLFASVCDAVHHGHQKGIIHRDLKPGNILVDPNGNVKVIDFGVARGTDSDLVVTTLQTEIGQLVGTLQYMSPEQCEGDPDAIDARSDVYALGVVLYELLVGRPPYTIVGEPVIHGTRVIREQAPTRPSTIDRTLRGDVETIVLQTLEKDPDRRYASAAGLARDIRSYLSGEAIQARPPSAVYRVRLFARRHRAGVMTVATLALIAVLAAVLVVRSHRRARLAEDAMAAALERASQAEIAAGASMRLGAPTKLKTKDLVGQVPGEFSLTLLDGGKIGTSDLADYKATVLNFVAADCPFCYKQMPMVEKIRAEYEPQGVRFVNVPLKFKQEFTHEESRDRFAQLGSRIPFAGDGSEPAGDLFKVSGYPTLCVLDSSGRVRHVTSGSKSDLMAHLRGYLDALILGIATPEEALAEAEKRHRQTLENNRRTLSDGHPDTLRSMENLAAVLTDQGKHDEAEKLYREICDTRERLLGESDPQTLASLERLAEVLQERDKPAEAEDVYRRVLETRRHILGEDHPETRVSKARLCMVLLAQGKTAEATPYMPELIELRRSQAQAQDVEAGTLNEYARLLLTCEPEELRDPATALEVAGSAAQLSGRHDADILATLALAQKSVGDLAQAIETQKEAVALVSPAEFLKRGSLAETLGRYYKEAGELDALEQWLRDDIASTRAVIPPGSPPMLGSLVPLAMLLLERERWVEAERVIRECREIGRSFLPEGHPARYQGDSGLGAALIGQGRFEEAEPLVVNAYLHLREIRGVPQNEMREAHEQVVRLYTEWGKPEEAARYRDMAPPDEAAEPSDGADG